MSVHRVLPEFPVRSFAEYEATGVGGRGIARAVELGPEATIAEVMASGLRGRGGGGFPTGRKWSTVANDPSGRRYVVCNGAEGEPATYKDRTLLRMNPYQVVEGVVIAAYAVGAQGAYLAVKGTFTEEIAALEKAIAEIQEAGICRDCDITIVQGPDEYLFGEEKALLEVIEGNPPLPRVLPPFQHGLFASASQSGWTASP
ncbi:MAG: NADH-quinone oxidoreductase subunit, partial [Acidimicrobiia bacterium]|nr:NADH-quinone oxidoreductase subunit [Acidimicrobiia bacterium]